MDPVLSNEHDSVTYWRVDDAVARLPDLATPSSISSGESVQTAEYLDDREEYEGIEQPIEVGHWSVPVLDDEEQRWLEVYDCLRGSGLVRVAPFPQTTTGNLIQYLAAGSKATAMSRGLTHLNARAHGVVATPNGRYDHRWLTDRNNPFPILSSITEWTLPNIKAWLEVVYGLPDVNLLMLTDTSLVPSDPRQWRQWVHDLHSMIRVNNPAVVNLSSDGALVWRNPPSTRAVAAIASVFKEIALTQPVLGGGCWYLLARQRRSAVKDWWLTGDGIVTVNDWWSEHRQVELTHLEPIEWAMVLDRLNLPVDVAINNW